MGGRAAVAVLLIVTANYLACSVQGLSAMGCAAGWGVGGLLTLGIEQKPLPPSYSCRGCTCVEQSVLGGVAHLLSFDGTGGWVVGSGGRERRACGRCLGG